MSNDFPKGFTGADDFACWVPCQAVLAKGGKKGADKTGKRWIQGIASTSAKDLQGEVVAQDGIDFSYFMKHGYFNNDHQKGFQNKVGQPTECKLTKNGLFVKGYLFDNNEVSDNIWGMMKTLNNSGSSRRVGFSIEGKVKRRAGSSIKECWIQDIAITAAPVNHTTWCEMAKSLSAQNWDLSKGCDEDNNDDNDENSEKALAVGGGSPLVPESMGRELKEDRTSKSLTYDEAVESIMKSKGCSQDAAESIANIAFKIFS